MITTASFLASTEVEPIADALLRFGFGYILFAPPFNLIPKVMKGWNSFLALPWEERMRWQCGDPLDYDDGYAPRIPKKPHSTCEGCPGCASEVGGTEYDDKHFFHYRPHLTVLLDKKGVDYTAHLEWLADLDELYAFSRNASYETLLRLDEVVTGFNFTERFSSADAIFRHVLRLLSYNGEMSAGVQLAKNHVDRCAFTIQVHESESGLVLNIPEPIPYVARPDHALFFTGAKAALLTKNSPQPLHAINHGVYVPDGYVPEAISEPRQSIVFFSHIFPETP